MKHTRTGQHYKTAEARDYEEAVALLAKQSRIRPIVGPVEASAIFYRGERRGKTGKSKLVRCDLDDLEKVLWDSLQGFAYLNDSQIHAKHTYLREDRANPRVEVRVEAVE